jgi:ABC-type oligopeptide transport system substrate-binding subunit
MREAMRRFVTFALALALLAAGVAPSAGQPSAARAKDSLVVALVSHPPTLDPHMQYEWVGILVSINMFDSLLHRNARLEYERLWPFPGRPSTTPCGSSSCAKG